MVKTDFAAEKREKKTFDNFDNCWLKCLSLCLFSFCLFILFVSCVYCAGFYEFKLKINLIKIKVFYFGITKQLSLYFAKS